MICEQASQTSTLQLHLGYNDSYPTSRKVCENESHLKKCDKSLIPDMEFEDATACGICSM
ncbi:unnamed protein product [Acanthoscelides obtectus]|uniref:Uncharacterized protein n=1 Tax=Acanthoscelides obtectus TaxID=200917 RepID=A0A9P0LXL3_ACAOB|nr:unnamed protein product [Acanthoscelides obtectus]CAK1624020.1 hypothetical protein AOBTE_LOCUS2286 [Acanthoscelides obtectus]